jgi:hypothetical protein
MMSAISEEISNNEWIKHKDLYRVQTTEELFNIDPVPDFQCDFITDIKNKVGNIEMAADVKRRDEDDLEVLTDKLWGIRHDVYGLEDDVEKLRDAITLVREWGQQWKDMCKKIIIDKNIDIDDLI